MEKGITTGNNRTGMDMSPVQGRMMVSGAEAAPHSAGNESDLHSLGRDYIASAQTVGSVPLPGTLRGALKALKDKLSGKHTAMLLNKIGERLAFERSGVRLYEAFIAKCEAAEQEGTLPSALELQRLRQFCVEEAQHFSLLCEVLVAMGADPTAQTPDADVAAMASQGQMKVIQDPRTTVSQCLESLLSIEMMDNAAWAVLERLARDMTMDEIAQQFRLAAEQEDRHLLAVRAWHEAAVREEAGLDSAAAPRAH